MAERLIRKIFRRFHTEEAKQQSSEPEFGYVPGTRIENIDPVSQPGLARLQGFLIPGVVKGRVGNTDFDHRDEFGRPTRIKHIKEASDTTEIPKSTST